MKKPMRNLIAGSMLAATLLGSGAAATAQASATNTQSSTQTPKPPSKAERAKHEAQRTAALAKALGLSTAKVKTAEQAARAAVEAKYGKPPAPPTTPPTTKPVEPTDAQKAEMKARHDLFLTTFAEKLGITTDQLKAGMLKVEKAHLAAEVKAGRLTQAQADEIIKAIEDGTAPPMGPGGPGHGGPGQAAPGR